MRSLVLLTTDTPHHRYFAREISAAARLQAIVVETAHAKASFHVEHPFEARRDDYEREQLLGGKQAQLSEFAEVLTVERANDPQALELLGRKQPDLIVSFGTGLLEGPLLGAARLACLNLHGGDPQRYRGLDSHLWAIYHREFDALQAALHHVEREFDTGDLVGQLPVPIRQGMELHELRAANTKACVDLVRRALASAETGALARRPQRSRGRYYSFMPACLKALCVERFRRHALSI